MLISQIHFSIRNPKIIYCEIAHKKKLKKKKRTFSEAHLAKPVPAPHLDGLGFTGFVFPSVV